MDNSSIELFIYNITLYYIPILCQKYSVRVCVRGPYSEARTLPSHVRCVKDSQSSLPEIFYATTCITNIFHAYKNRCRCEVNWFCILQPIMTLDQPARSTDFYFHNECNLCSGAML